MFLKQQRAVSQFVLRKLVYFVGDIVHIAKTKLPLPKGYNKTFSKETFKINRLFPGEVTSYQLQDKLGKIANSKFYAQELVKSAVKGLEK